MRGAAGEDHPGHRLNRLRARRPFLVTLLALLVLTITATHLVRFLLAVSWWDFLSSLPRVSPIYLALTGLIWTLVGLPLAWGLWTGFTRVPQAMQIFTLVYALYWWLEKLWIARSNREEATNWPFAAGLTAVLLVTVFWTFSRPRAKAFFGDMNEQPR